VSPEEKVTAQKRVALWLWALIFTSALLLLDWWPFLAAGQRAATIRTVCSIGRPWIDAEAELRRRGYGVVQMGKRPRMVMIWERLPVEWQLIEKALNGLGGRLGATYAYAPKQYYDIALDPTGSISSCR
jgi:hypothetical protein